MIEISHDHADGTLAYGTKRGDAADTILRACGFRWKPSYGALGLLKSADHPAKRWIIREAVEKLRAAGIEVTVEIDGEPRSYEQVAGARQERAAYRAVTYGARAEKAEAASEGAWKAGMQILDAIPPGQPILVGHHSQRKHERDLERVDRLHRRASEEHAKAKYLGHRAEHAANSEAYRMEPGAIERRIERDEAELRKVIRNLNGYQRRIGGYVEEHPPTTGEFRESQLERKAWLETRIAGDREALASIRAKTGATDWSHAGIKAGDYIQCGGDRWFRVKRANKKTLTCLVPVPGSDHPWEQKLPYHKVTGHKTEDES